MKLVLHIDLDKDNLDKTIRELIEEQLKSKSTKQTDLLKSDSNESKCADCDKAIPDYVANFCKNNKDKFKGKLLCMTCQEKYQKEE